MVRGGVQIFLVCYMKIEFLHMKMGLNTWATSPGDHQWLWGDCAEAQSPHTQSPHSVCCSQEPSMAVDKTRRV